MSLFPGISTKVASARPIPQSDMSIWNRWSLRASVAGKVWKMISPHRLLFCSRACFVSSSDLWGSSFHPHRRTSHGHGLGHSGIFLFEAAQFRWAQRNSWASRPSYLFLPVTSERTSRLTKPEQEQFMKCEQMANVDFSKILHLVSVNWIFWQFSSAPSSGWSWISCVKFQPTSNWSFMSHESWLVGQMLLTVDQ
jgi:hypothetical protein